ncbi:Imm7 family immunity protein [Streptomyces tauricus]
MFDYHGWITVRETAADDDDARLRQIVDELRLRIAQMLSTFPQAPSPLHAVLMCTSLICGAQPGHC